MCPNWGFCYARCDWMASVILTLIFLLNFINVEQVLWELLVMMSRPMLLVFLLIMLIITSQFEWKQQLVIDLDPTPTISQKQHQISKREEAVKEKVKSLSHFLLYMPRELFAYLVSEWRCWSCELLYLKCGLVVSCNAFKRMPAYVLHDH